MPTTYYLRNYDMPTLHTNYCAPPARPKIGRPKRDRTEIKRRRKQKRR